MRVFAERQRSLAPMVLAMVALEILASAMRVALCVFDIGVLAADRAAVPARRVRVATPPERGSMGPGRSARQTTARCAPD